MVDEKVDKYKIDHMEEFGTPFFYEGGECLHVPPFSYRLRVEVLKMIAVAANFDIVTFLIFSNWAGRPTQPGLAGLARPASPSPHWPSPPPRPPRCTHPLR